MAKQPILHKTKSKIRLRLGLDPSPVKDVPSAVVPSKPAPLTESTSSNVKSTPPAPLGASTKTVVSAKTTSTVTSRADSRSAFTLDYSPSSREDEHNHQQATSQRHDARLNMQHHRLQQPSSHRADVPFDIISFRSTSTVSLGLPQPEQLGYNFIPSSDNPGLATTWRPYPTPSPTNSDATTTEAAADNFSNLHDESRFANFNEYVKATDDIFMITDEALDDRFKFLGEIGFGNWGSVWLAQPRKVDHGVYASSECGKHMSRLGRAAAMTGGGGGGGRVAIKLVNRRHDPVAGYRVRGLWGEMKVIQALKHEPHPSIIFFEAFIITQSYALVIMPLLSHMIPVTLPEHTATPYFRQICSAIGYLHERGATHNDIKPSNIMLTYNDVPVLIDFGFAQKWTLGDRNAFLSKMAWGSPEYLDPWRAHSQPHDERLSDVWSLGITMYEILIGRTPFEVDEEEDFLDCAAWNVYYERCNDGHWLGEWKMSAVMEDLLRRMICPIPEYRCTAMEAYHHPALLPDAPAAIVTPHFVRAAATHDLSEPLPHTSHVDPYAHAQALTQQQQHQQHYAHTQPQPRAHYETSHVGPGQHHGVHLLHHEQGHNQQQSHERHDQQPPQQGRQIQQEADKKKRKTKKPKTAAAGQLRATTPTPTALGESIKQHSSVGRPKRERAKVTDAGDNGRWTDKENTQVDADQMPMLEGNKLVIKNQREVPEKGIEEDPTPTKVLKPAQPLQPLRVKELVPRTSESQNPALSRASSASTLDTSRSTNVVQENHKLRESKVTTVSSRNLRAEAEVAAAVTLTTTSDPAIANAPIQSSEPSIMVPLPDGTYRFSTVSNTSSAAPKSKEEAVQKAMRSLEGHRHRLREKPSRDVLGKITRPAPAPPVADNKIRPKSSEEVLGKEKVVDVRRSLGIGRIVEEQEEEARPLLVSSEHASIVIESESSIDSQQAEEVEEIRPSPVPTPRKGRKEHHPSPARSHSIRSYKSKYAGTPSKRHTHGTKPADIAAAELAEEVARNSLDTITTKSVEVDGGDTAAGNVENGGKAPRVSLGDLLGGNGKDWPMAELRERIMSTDEMRFRKVSGNLTRPLTPASKSGHAADVELGIPAIPALPRTKSVEALAMGSKLDKLSEWVKGVEVIIEEARRAIAEGREPPLPIPSLPAELVQPGPPQPAGSDISASPTAPELAGLHEQIHAETKAQSRLEEESEQVKHQFGLTPSKDALPEHLRTSSVQVEPATPPKWMTYAEAEEKVRAANGWVEPKRVEKKERPSVSHVLKLFGGDKEEKRNSTRSNTPEPNFTVPLKPPGLRGMPSTPAFGTSTTRSMPLRKSESNLRHPQQYDTMPAMPPSHLDQSGYVAYDEDDDEDIIKGTRPYTFTTRQRGVYEQLLSSTPGVVRQGDGWGSWSSGKANAMGVGKQSSMASLREKAKAFLTGNSTGTGTVTATEREKDNNVNGHKERQIVNLASGTTTTSKEKEIKKRSSKVQFSASAINLAEAKPKQSRPATPGASALLASTSTNSTSGGNVQGKEKEKKGKGLFKNFMGWAK